MTPVHRAGRAVAVTMALVLADLSLPTALAQALSPYFKTTGEGAYDLYNDAVLCSVVLEGQAETLPDSDERKHLDGRASDARVLALLLLESGNVVDMSGAILGPDNLPIDLHSARFGWQVVVHSLEDEGMTPEAEIARCLAVYEAR